MANRKKIMLLFCGGTTLFPEKVAFQAVHKKEDIIPWMKNVAEMKMICDVTPYFIFGGEASDVGAKEWIKIAETIGANYRKYDGFVITHGVETLPYTAAVLSFMLANLGKPVILTGSPVPSQEESSAEILQAIFKNFRGLGIKANLINAAQVAISDIAGLLVVFGSRIIAGTRLEKFSDFSPNYFESSSQQVIGKIDFGLTLYDQSLKRSAKRPKIAAQVDPKVTIFDFHPGMDFSLLKNVLDSRPHGLIIKTQSSSFFPESVYRLLKAALKKGMPIVIYASGGFRRVKTEEFIYVDHMSLVTTVVKLMWILGQTRNVSRIKKMMLTDYSGETKGGPKE
ncbi:MAG: asparaginase domain-containing protein [Patescibacteria group bacterium]